MAFSWALEFLWRIHTRTYTLSVCPSAGESGVKTFDGELSYKDPANGNADTIVPIDGDTEIIPPEGATLVQGFRWRWIW